MKIETINGVLRYWDVKGKEIHEDDRVWMNDRLRVVYRADDGSLGTDATNPSWIESGRAYPCEYGIYPFSPDDEPFLIL